MNKFPELELSDQELEKTGTVTRTTTVKGGYITTVFEYVSHDSKTRIYKTIVTPDEDRFKKPSIQERIEEAKKKEERDKWFHELGRKFWAEKQKKFLEDRELLHFIAK
jgi:hypothetical protein